MGYGRMLRDMREIDGMSRKIIGGQEKLTGYGSFPSVSPISCQFFQYPVSFHRIPEVSPISQRFCMYTVGLSVKVCPKVSVQISLVLKHLLGVI